MPAAALSPRILYVTDLAYEARGRRYCDEDIMLCARLRRDFTIATCHPADAARLMGDFDGVLVRNSGPVTHYREVYDAFRERASADGVRVYNPLTGRGDMAGKQYLVELSAAGFPSYRPSTGPRIWAGCRTPTSTSSSRRTGRTP